GRPAVAGADDERLLPSSVDPLVAPEAESGQHRPEVASLLRQPVLVAAARCRLRLCREDAVGDEPAKPIREDVAGDAEGIAEAGEVADAEERLAHDQERPPVADQVEGAGDGARHPVEALPGPGRTP